jgi:hypothetical protein
MRFRLVGVPVAARMRFIAAGAFSPPSPAGRTDGAIGPAPGGVADGIGQHANANLAFSAVD